jgi:hypothetical protein
MAKRPRIFITYAHADDAQQDFQWVVQQVETAGAEVEYDDRVLVVGQRLWPQIEARILEPGLDGWGILLTPSSLASAACMEELEYARVRALSQRSLQFPLIAMVHDVPAEEIPLGIRSRLYVSLQDPHWPRRVVAGLNRTTHYRDQAELQELRWQVHPAYLGDPELFAVEARPRVGSWQYVAVATPQPGFEQSGVGAPGGKPTGGGQIDSGEGTVELEGEMCAFVTMRGPVSPGASIYSVFRGRVPHWVAVGKPDGPWELPRSWERFVLDASKD